MWYAHGDFPQATCYYQGGVFPFNFNHNLQTEDQKGGEERRIGP